MTVAILNTETPFTIASRWSGCRLDTVNGKKHYVSTDQNNRAVVGPVAKRRRPRKAPVLAMASPDDRPLSLADVGASISHRVRASLPTPPPPQKRGLFRRMADSMLGRFYDKDWHHAVQHAALDVICWALAVGVVSFVAKALVWTWL